MLTICEGKLGVDSGADSNRNSEEKTAQKSLHQGKTFRCAVDRRHSGCNRFLE